MAHFNNADADRQSASTSSRPTPTSSWLNTTPIRPIPIASGPNSHFGRTPVPEDTYDFAPGTPTNSRSVHVQRDCTSCSQTGPGPEESPCMHNRSPLKRHRLTYDSAPPGSSNSNEARTQGDDQIASSKCFWPMSGRCDEAAGSQDSAATHTRSTQPPFTLTWVSAQTQ